MTSSVEAVKRARDHAEDAIGFLQDLIRLRTDTPAGYGAAADTVAARLAELGFDVQRFDVADATGALVPSVLGWAGPRTTTPILVLNAHLDTNPAGEGWSVSEYGGERREGRVFGRGSVIAKSDVSAFAYGVSAACAHSRANVGTVLVAITCDEGGGGNLGPGHILEELGIRPRRAMTAGFTPIVGVAHNGAVQGVVTVRGIASHQAAVDPASDAMQHAVRIAAAIGERDLELRRRGSTTTGIAHPTFNVTRFRAGTSFGMAPGLAELLIDRRVTPDEVLAEAEQDVRAVVHSVPHGDAVAVELDLRPGVEPMRPTAGQLSWAELVRDEAAAVLGHPVPMGGIPIYTDARLFATAGIPTVLFGAGDPDLVAAGVNGVDESVAEADVAAAVQIVARVVERVLTAPD